MTANPSSLTPSGGSPPITVAIVHWNQPESCLATIERFLADDQVADVIVVDNSSERAARALVADHVAASGRVELIELDHNSGFGPGVNRAWERWLSARSTPWCAVAPHDALPAEGTLRTLVETGTAERLGLVSADVGDGLRHIVDHVFGPIGVDHDIETGYLPVDYPHGTLMLASRECLTTVGLFDERFFAYCEEADLGLRAAAAGFPSGLVVGARVRNPHVNTPTALVDYLKERNTVLLVAIHFGRRKAAVRFALTLWQLARGLIQPSSRGDYWSARARLLAIRDIVRRRWGPPPRSLQGRRREPV